MRWIRLAGLAMLWAVALIGSAVVGVAIGLTFPWRL